MVTAPDIACGMGPSCGGVIPVQAPEFLRWRQAMSRTIQSVAVLGGGFMGAGIAESASIAGFPVMIRELPEFTAAARSPAGALPGRRGETREARRRQAS